jgi:PAS domain S-box-containing protein
MVELDDLERLRREHEERLEALDLLEQARDAYAELYELAPLAMFIVLAGPRFLVQGLNLAAGELLGRPPKSLLGMSFTDLIHGQDRELVAACLRGDRSRLTHAPVRLVSRDGEVSVRLAAVTSKTEPTQLHISATPVGATP